MLPTITTYYDIHACACAHCSVSLHPLTHMLMSMCISALSVSSFSVGI